MNFENIIQVMLEAFPELVMPYENEGIYLRGIPHVTFSVVFCKYVHDIFLSMNNSKKVEIADFINQMLDSDDKMVHGIVAVTILSNVFYEGLSDEMKPYLGSRTREILDRQPL